MLYPRLIPSLLVNSDRELVKTTYFENANYIGDPLNAAYIFSNFEVDELLVLDIDASKQERCIPLDFVESISNFTKVPLTIGGGIKDLNQIHDILSLGVERIAISSILSKNFEILNQASTMYGSSSISVIINAYINKRGDFVGIFGRPDISKKHYPINEISYLCQENGAGEIIINCINREGTRKGFNINLMQSLNETLSIPLVALGGCGKIDHINELIKKTPISGISCGTFFVYANESSQVLLNYEPTAKWLKDNFKEFKEIYKNEF